MTGIDEVILCDNKAKNVAIAIAIATARLFNEVSVQKNELKRLGYFITIPKVVFKKIRFFQKIVNLKLYSAGANLCQRHHFVAISTREKDGIPIYVDIEGCHPFLQKKGSSHLVSSLF